MAVKAKKRKLLVTDQDGTSAEDELQRQEEEMLTMTRLLKQVDEKDVLSVAKHILTNATVVTREEAGADDNTRLVSNGASPTLAGTLDRSRQHHPRHTRSHNNTQLQQEGVADVVTRNGIDDDAEGQPELTNALFPSKLSFANPTTNGTVSTTSTRSPSVKEEDESPWMNLSVFEEHNQDEQYRQRFEEPRTTTMIVNGSAMDHIEISSSKRTFVSVLRSGRRRVVPLPETTTYIAVTDTTAMTAVDGEEAASGSSSVVSDGSTSYVASIMSDPSSSSPSSGSAISVTFRSESEENPRSPNMQGFDIPISALVTPRLTKTLIQQKARSTYAPSALIQQEQPKRRPGRPPGYFLGPTSCTYCRTQHRRCDYNTVCMRCVKAKISCDRSGTVERPSVIVREARQQAKAEAAAALAAAVAAGLAVPPEKPRPPQRHTQLHSLKLEAAAITARMPTPVPPPSTTAVKRRRTPSPSDVTKDNIIERRTKRLAALKPVEKYDPSIYLKPKRKLSIASSQVGDNPANDNVRNASVASSSSLSTTPQRGRSRTRDDEEAGETDDYIRSSKRTSTNPPSRSISKDSSLARETAKRESKRSIGGKLEEKSAHLSSINGRARQREQEQRKLAAIPSDSILTIKRGPGRPSNAMRYAMNPALFPPPKPEKIKRGPGRPRKDSYATTTTSATTTTIAKASSSVVPLKRTRNMIIEKAATTKNSKGKQTAIDTPEEDSGSTQEEESKTPIRLVRKVYLKSGLYSADLKVNPTNSKLSVITKPTYKQGHISKALVTQSKRGTRVNSAAHQSPFFQLPINYGVVLMSKQRDFRLPYDIMQAWQAGLLRKKPQPEPFLKIRSNVFVERRRRTETSPMVCHCKPPPPGAGRVGCGEDCYNRVMFYECISAFCPCKDQCSNQRFQKKHNEDHLRVIWTQERGFGIQTMKPIKKGSLVVEYRGEVISQSECHRRMESIYKNNKNFYFLEYEKGEVVDACQKGTNARFVNHSCSPNSQIEKWYLNGEMSIGIFSSQDIPAGAEISYDYNFSSFSGAQKQKCRCGAPNCRGYIGERISKNKEPAAIAPNNGQSSGRVAKKVDGRKRKAGRRKLNDPESSSIRLAQMPSVKQIRQRQSDKYKEDKMAAIRYTKLFLFRNIRLVESKYIKYAQTKSRSYHETVSRAWLMQARQCRKRSLEGVVEDLRAAAREKEDEEQREWLEEEQSGSSEIDEDDDSDPSAPATAEGSFILELEADDMEEYEDDNDNDDIDDDDGGDGGADDVGDDDGDDEEEEDQDEDEDESESGDEVSSESAEEIDTGIMKEE
ncbi:Histone-Lysine N-Methyltransferase ash1l [Modicella reniformis]|uniref:Histone-Lysine N-Methyltransferase ash1l n=1 Tax=Modicella reniformis TaxID=1440133 RepID=A0A9P6MBW0_9FUNG|nr:Histone-Lysine N-Methyltransferase ash1l [Modicella reniformis]